MYKCAWMWCVISWVGHWCCYNTEKLIQVTFPNGPWASIACAVHGALVSAWLFTTMTGSASLATDLHLAQNMLCRERGKRNESKSQSFIAIRNNWQSSAGTKWPCIVRASGVFSFFSTVQTKRSVATLRLTSAVICVPEHPWGSVYLGKDSNQWSDHEE